MTPLLELGGHPRPPGRDPRAGPRSATRSSSRTTTSCPRSRTSPTTSATRSACPRRPRPPTRTSSPSAACTSWPRPPRSSRPQKTVLLPDLGAGCSLADSITADQLRAWKAQAPRRGRRHVRQHDGRGEGRDRLLLHVGATPCSVVEHIYRDPRRGHGDPLRPGHVPRRLRREARPAARCTSGTASATCTPASARATSREMRDGQPGRRLPHPPRVRLLDVGHGVRRRRRRRPGGRAHALHGRDARLRAQRRAGLARRSSRRRPGCCTRCSSPRPRSTSCRPTAAAVCQYMKMITLPKLRDGLRDLSPRGQGRPGARRARAGADRAHGGPLGPTPGRTQFP